MRVLYIDFSEGYEDLSTSPDRYGGCQIVPAFCREMLMDFHILAHPNSLSNIKPWERRGHCHEMTNEQAARIRNGERLEDIISRPNLLKFDILLHCSTKVHVNTSIPQAVWVPGQYEEVHPENKHLLLHSPEFQHPLLTRTDHHIHKVKIGKPVSNFQEHDKSEDLIFQCSNHAPCFQSIEVAKMAKALKIQVYFGGPISEGYPLLNEVDNKYVHYLGVMKYEDKIAMTKRARVHTLLHNFPINFTLSGLEALAYGCGLMTTPIGFWPTFITPKIGRMVCSAFEFAKAYEELKSINQYDCWLKAKENDATKMVMSFNDKLEDVLCYETRRDL